MDYVVQEQDCFANIAAEHGFTWKALWNHSNNSALKQQRKQPTVLHPGDIVHIPDKEIREEPGATEKRHRFKKKNELVWLRIRLLEDGKPRKNLKYELRIGTQSYQGQTDGNGKLEQKISAGVMEAQLITAEDSYVFKLGQLNPVDEMSGVQQRLQNLGYYSQSIDGQTTDATQAAIKAFQGKAGLPVNGELNESTRQKLLQAHGS